MFEGFKRMRDNRRLSSLYKKDKFTHEEEKFVLEMLRKSDNPILIFHSINPNALTVGICSTMYGYCRYDKEAMHKLCKYTPKSIIKEITHETYLLELCKCDRENFNHIDHKGMHKNHTRAYLRFKIKFGEHLEGIMNAFKNTYLRDPDERMNRVNFEVYWNSYQQHHYLPAIKELNEIENRIQETIDMIYGKDEDNTEVVKEESANGKGEAAKQVIENSNHIDDEEIDHPDDIDDDNVSS